MICVQAEGTDVLLLIPFYPGTMHACMHACVCSSLAIYLKLRIITNQVLLKM